MGVAIAVAVVASRALGQRLSLPDAVPLVLLGVAASFLPGLPTVRLAPDVVFLLFLPPLVYHAGFFTAPRETKANALPIGVLALGLVVGTTVAVAGVARLAVPGLGWAPAFVLGAIVAPTDPVAATAVLQRLGAPARITTILEGESLANDGIALTIFALALQSIGSGFSVGYALVRFIEVALGGIAYGLAVGWVIGHLRRAISDPGIQIVASLVTPYLAYIPANTLGLSGVLAAVSAGFYLGTRAKGLFEPTSRLQSNAFWNVLVFLLESLLFVLLGLQFRSILGGIEGISSGGVVLATGAVVGVVLVIRLAWEAVVPLGIGRLRRLRTPDFTSTPWRHRLVIGWSGIRGAISFAAALSIPVMARGRPFPDRGLLVFITIIVVLVTLVGQATTLPPLLRALGLAEGDRERGEQILARRLVAEAGLRRLEELAGDERINEETANAVRQLFEMRLDRLRAQGGEPDGDDGRLDAQSVRMDLVAAQREALRHLYTEGRIGSEARRAVTAELDLEESRLRRQE